MSRQSVLSPHKIEMLSNLVQLAAFFGQPHYSCFLLWFNAAFLLSCKAYSDRRAYTFVRCLSASGFLMATGSEGPETLPLFALGSFDLAQVQWLALGVAVLYATCLYLPFEKESFTIFGSFNEVFSSSYCPTLFSLLEGSKK